jgi:hypothetical protein
MILSRIVLTVSIAAGLLSLPLAVFVEEGARAPLRELQFWLAVSVLVSNALRIAFRNLATSVYNKLEDKNVY